MHHWLNVENGQIEPLSITNNSMVWVVAGREALSQTKSRGSKYEYNNTTNTLVPYTIVAAPKGCWPNHRTTHVMKLLSKINPSRCIPDGHLPPNMYQSTASGWSVARMSGVD